MNTQLDFQQGHSDTGFILAGVIPGFPQTHKYLPLHLSLWHSVCAGSCFFSALLKRSEVSSFGSFLFSLCHLLMSGEHGNFSFCLSVLRFQNFLSVQPSYHKGEHIFKAKLTDVKIWQNKSNPSQVTKKLYGKRYPTDVQRTINCYQNMILDMLFSDVKSSSPEIFFLADECSERNESLRFW